MKKFLVPLLALIVLTIATTTFAEPAEVESETAARPVRIARVPIIFQSTVPDEKTCEALETKIKRAIHIPLNGYLQVAEYLPMDNTARELNDLWQDIKAGNKKAKLADAMRPLADRLDADIIVCPILVRYSQYVVGFSTWSGEQYIDSNAEVELIVYDRRTDNLRDKIASRMHHDTMSALGTAPYLANVCFDIVIEATKIRELIHAIGR